VRVQTPEGNNAAPKLVGDQLAVTDPDGGVRTFFGPVNAEGLEDAWLYASSAHLYTAVVALFKALDGDADPVMCVR
jgi:hypothetical protein